MLTLCLRRISNSCAKSKIPFNFAIPRESAKVNSPTAEPSEPKTLSRKGKVKGLKLLSESEVEASHFQENYQQRCQEVLQHNLRTHNYFHHDYGKGEDLLEKVPLDPYYEYKKADQQRFKDQKYEELMDELSPERNFQTTAYQMRKVTDVYDQKQRKYEQEEYQAHLARYPGSPEGPRPEDDIDHYTKYAQQNIPRGSKVDFTISEQQEDQSPMLGGAFNWIDFFGKNRDVPSPEELQLPEDRNEEPDPVNYNDPHAGFYPVLKTQFPQFPRIPFRDYQDYFAKYSAWKAFKYYFLQRNINQKLETIITNYLSTEDKVQPDEEWVVPQPCIPSLYRYYKTLPLSLQDHPGLRNIYLGLEYYSPDYSYEEKQSALNYAASICLPIDTVTERAMEDFLSYRKYYITPFFINKIKTVDPEFTWDIFDFMEELKRQELKGLISPKEKEERFPEPPPVHMEWDEGAPNLPADYYENDDGFWDSVIAQKLKRYDAARPMLRTRRHFSH